MRPAHTRARPPRPGHLSPAGGPQRLLSRRLAWLLAGTLGAMLAFTPGCLTDGSIPVGGTGGTGVLRGVVVHGDNPDVAISGARVAVRTWNGLVGRAETDAQGRWALANAPSGELDVTVDGPDPQAVLPVRLGVRADTGPYSSVAVALPPAQSLSAPVSALEMSPVSSTVVVGRTAIFQVRMAGGGPALSPPVWVAEGGVGTISPRGEFRAERPGTGTIRATIGGVSATSAVQVIAASRQP